MVIFTFDLIGSFYFFDFSFTTINRKALLTQSFYIDWQLCRTYNSFPSSADTGRGPPVFDPTGEPCLPVAA